ncbi:cation:proton antiporter [Streptomyces sp. NPDC096324]|uniref:cation:proton antiporter n=1 Tax=Streptomyces sp. NPDC096324 TaxID=3366085 RepID=UPI003804A68D
MTTDDVLTGVALIMVFAVGSQLLASVLRIPSLIVMLPVGFAAGALIDDINPQQLLGAAFSPLVSLGVAVILYDAGLGLDLGRFRGHNRTVVTRLIWLGVPATCLLGAALAIPLLSMSHEAAIVLGAVLVVSGPTVVGPLLGIVRPKDRLRHILVWEGSLIDPVGGILGAVVFHAVAASTESSASRGIAHFAASVGTGVAGGVIGAAALWALFHVVRPGEVLGTTAQLAVVMGVAAGCDILRDDSGLIAAVLMGLSVANISRIDIPVRRRFFETLVSLIIGLLFTGISATVTPASLNHVGLPALGLAAFLIVVVRPLVVAMCTFGTDLSRGERCFVGWMAPRGIVAAATASTFTSALVADHVDGAAKILPATFVVIVVTVTLYGLTAAPVARLLRVKRPSRSRPLLVGGAPWVIDLGATLRSTGMDVLMWAGPDEQRDRIQRAGLEIAPGAMLGNATGSGAELEGVTGVFLLTDEDDFNALASAVLRGGVEGPVLRVGATRGSHSVVVPYRGREVLFGPHLTGPALARRHQAGSAIVAAPAADGVPADSDLLFVVRPGHRLEPVTGDGTPRLDRGDTLVLLAPATGDRPTGKRAP